MKDTLDTVINALPDKVTSISASAGLAGYFTQFMDTARPLIQDVSLIIFVIVSFLGMLIKFRELVKGKNPK